MERDRERLKSMIANLETDLEKANSGDKSKINELKSVKDQLDQKVKEIEHMKKEIAFKNHKLVENESKFESALNTKD